MKIVFTSSIVLSLAIFISCNTKKEHEISSQRFVLKIKGSDTEYEMVKNLCAQFKDSDTLDYHIEGGGTETGFRAMINGEIDMATASREITDKEKHLLDKQGVKALPIMFATDAVAVITHPHLGVDSLTLDQLSKIYTGRIINWKDVGGPDRKITLFTRNVSSGTFSYFKNKVTQGDINTDARVCETTKDIVDSVIRDSSGIGYVGSGFLVNKSGKPSGKVWAMPLCLDSRHPAVSPYQAEEVKNGNYPLSRPLYQYYKLPVNNHVKNFILFELTLRGQALIRSFGYFPINDCQKEINKLNGFDLE